jgi:DNA-binding transcriptional ArsR family regulator
MPAAARSDRELSRILEALSNETRLQVLRLVAQAGSLYCRELLGRFSLSQPTMSHHLNLLVSAGVLHEHRDGLRRYYTVDRDLLKRFGLNILD